MFVTEMFMYLFYIIAEHGETWKSGAVHQQLSEVVENGHMPRLGVAVREAYQVAMMLPNYSVVTHKVMPRLYLAVTAFFRPHTLERGCSRDQSPSPAVWSRTCVRNRY